MGITKLGEDPSRSKLTAHAGRALALANIRYWPTVAPIVRSELERWEWHASRIADGHLRELALAKLHEEHFNAEVAATLATLAPRAERQRTIEAIVAFEVMYDYLDGLTELPTADPLRDGRQLFKAFTDALATDVEPDCDYYRYRHSHDGGYLATLTHTVRTAFGRLPGAAAVMATAQASAARCAEAQVRAHAAPRIGKPQLRDWAVAQAAATNLDWRAYIAGAVASVLAVHALIAAAADSRVTSSQARELDSAYLSISALTTMLDSLIDHERDSREGSSSYLEHYPDRRALAGQLASVSLHARHQAQTLRHGAHHVMTLIGVVAYYTSAPTARGGVAGALAAQIQSELRPLITPTLALMRLWRALKRLRAGSHALSTHSS